MLKTHSTHIENTLTVLTCILMYIFSYILTLLAVLLTAVGKPFLAKLYEV